MDYNESIKEKEFSGINQNLTDMKRRLEKELSRVNLDLSEKINKNQDLRNIKRKYEAMQVLGVHKVPTIDEIVTERTMQVLEVSEGPVQPVGFWRNPEVISESEEASSKNLEVFLGIFNPTEHF